MIMQEEGKKEKRKCPFCNNVFIAKIVKVDGILQYDCARCPNTVIVEVEDEDTL